MTRDYKKYAANACEPRMCSKLRPPLTLHDDLCTGLAQAHARDLPGIMCTIAPADENQEVVVLQHKSAYTEVSGWHFGPC